ncbi:MAG: 2-oxo acid dehydrogenase subunit E2 [Candidatus Pseudothioglobus sp.]|jgi:pyruvate dehydrogenase E2 component (dihydrolipoamide acetyltransferase)|nr:biotin/lipoyl-binding protein [Candidatus Thioglobus sp.]HIL44601.1 biotin/lipoyl-binding protein [Candidatus Thioglobus sp.]
MPTKKNVELPDIGDFDSTDVIEVLVKVGDIVNENDSIITLETDKASMEIPAPFAGKVTSLSIKVGDKIAKGELILTLESESEEIKGELDQVEGKLENVEETIKQEDIDVNTDNSAPPQDSIENNDEPQEELSVKTEIDSHASPSIRKLARELGVSLAKITGTGQKGRILDEDLKSYVKQIVSHGGTDDEVEIVPLSRIKKISGKHLTKCWSTIPHVTQFDEVNIEQMEKFRLHQKERNIKLSPLVFIMKAVVQTLKRHPNFNASLDENGENLLIKKYFNLGIAVDTPNGLVVPVVRDVGRKSLIELSDELTEISSRAREGLLEANEMKGASFTISSLGGIGGTQFTPIINSPEVAILGVSRSQIKPIWNGDSFEPTATLPLALSYDHRVIDGAEGARFMAELNQILRNIMEMLL